MSTILNTNGTQLDIPTIDPGVTGKFYVVTAEWNESITHALRDGAVETLRNGGVADDMVEVVKVPGTVELVNIAGMLVKKADTAAVIVIGCVIRGDTPHFDYVCQIAADGVARLNAEGKSPVIFGVLTVNNLVQAQQRAGGLLGNKGSEAAATAIEMANIHAKYQ